jgi:cytochrome c biogenesis protein CcmG/thiol:disulfide interchange protein DsbE
MRRNSIVLFAVVFLLSVFAWAGWANWEYRRQENEKRMAMMAMEGVLVPAGAGDTNSTQLASPLQGKPAPAFTLDDLTGKKVSLANYKGKAVLINFWATWCGPCKLETPWLVELRNKYASQGFEVLGVNSEGDGAKPGSAVWDKDKAAVTKFIEQAKVPYPVLLNGDTLSKPYGGLDDLPASFYVDRNGVIVAAQVGIDSQSVIEKNIQKALGR